MRRAAHTLSDSEEKILADAAPMAGSANNIYTILANADFPYPTITLADGKTIKVDQAGYSELRTSPNRADREAAMSAFFNALGGFSRTLGVTMNSNVQKSLFYAKSRKYASDLEASLNGPNIPVSVYMRLVDGVNRHLPTFHRYLKLRKRMMGVTDDLHYYDLYAPLVASVDLRYTPEEAQEHVIGATAPLGKDYTDVLRRGFKDRWIDWYPTEGKVSGAYSNGGAYDVHPYMLLNYLGQYNDVSTLAHELGHTMQSYYSNKTQPYVTAGYPTFVAEVASTFNEALLIDYMLKRIKDTPTRLSIARQLSRRHQGDGLPSDAVRRVRAEDARDGGARRADHRRCAREAVSGHHPQVLRSRSEGGHRGRLHRPRVELHSALLS